MKNVSKYIYIIIALSMLIPVSAYAERPLEDASYSEGMKAIKEMHALNLLGVTGELIGIYKALNKASYAAAILQGRKWRPGEDDLGWADDPNYGKIRHDPLAGLHPKDKEIVKRRLGNIEYYNRLIETGDYADAQQKDLYIQGIKDQISQLKRTLAGYPDFFARAFPSGRGGTSSLSVGAKNKWVDTGIDIKKGLTLSINANGTWRLGSGPRACDADGLSNFPPYNGILYGTLVGKIGSNGSTFPIGKRFKAKTNKSGRLSLGVNDDNMTDNSGKISVSINIR